MSNNIVEVLYMVESPAPGVPSKNMCESMRRSSAPVVRCRDCVHMTRSMYCKMPGEEFTEAWFPVESDGFCAWGERKDTE